MAVCTRVVGNNCPSALQTWLSIPAQLFNGIERCPWYEKYERHHEFILHGMCILKYFACFLWCYGSSWGGTSVGTILLPQFYSLVSGRASQGQNRWNGKELKPLVDGEAFFRLIERQVFEGPNLLGQRPMRGSVLYLTLAVCVLLSLTSVKPPPQTLKQIHMPAPRSSWLAMGYANQRGRVLHVPGDRSAFLSCSGGGWRVQKHVTKAKICLVL